MKSLPDSATECDPQITRPGRFRVLPWQSLLRVCITLFLALAAPADGAIALQSELTSIQVLDRAIEAVEAVQCLQFRYTIPAVPNSEAATDPAALRDDHDRVVRKAIRAFWDSRGLMRMDMRVLQAEVNRVLIGGAAYDHVIYTVDGDTYRGRSELQRKARIRPEPNVLTNDVTPMTLLGYGICGVGNCHVSRYLLDRGTLAPVPTITGDGLLKVSGEFDPSNGTYRRAVVVTVDPRQDYLPVGFKSTYVWCQVMELDVSVSATSIVDGVRVPTAGRLASYYVQELYPDGLTNADINAMTKESYFRDVEPRVQRVGTPISEPQEVQFETREMRVNDFKPLAFYCLDIPADYDVSDFRESTTLSNSGARNRTTLQTSTPATRPPGSRIATGDRAWNWFPWACVGVVNVIWLIVTMLVRARRRRSESLKASHIP